MTHSHFIEILLILTTYVFDLGVRLTEFSVTVESVTLRFYCTVFSEPVTYLQFIHTCYSGNILKFVLLQEEVSRYTYTGP